MRRNQVLSVVGGSAVTISIGSVVFAAATGTLGYLYDFFFYQTAAFALVLGLVALAASRRGTVNRGVWITSLCGLINSVEVAGLGLAVWTLRQSPELIQGLPQALVAPADLPTITAVLLMAERTWIISLGGFLTLGLLLFPDGRLPSRRWRAAAAAAAVGIVAYTSGYVTAGLPSSQVPWSLSPETPLPRNALNIGFVLVGISVLLALASLVVRHRNAGSDQRHQVRWMLFGVGAFALALVITFGLGALRFGSDFVTEIYAPANVVTIVMTPFVVATYGMGLVRYRLYDIDVVISRSLVFGLLAVFITGVYVAVVVGLGSMLGDPSNLVLAVSATAAIAIVFEPVRRRVERWANVLVYGHRATPYEVLSALNVPEQTVEDLMSTSAAVVAPGLGAEAVVVKGDDEVISSWPAEVALDVAAWDLEASLVHDGETVGSVMVKKKRGEHPTSQDRRLLDEFAGQASLLMANVLLNRRLESRLEELRESRRRLVTAQDGTRRRLERDLHDGAQQELVALRVKLGLARQVAGTEGMEEIVARLEELMTDADQAVDELRELARGIYPPLLEAEGLVAAVTAQARRLPVAVDVEPSLSERHPPEVEATVYFCVLEALGNAVRHSRAEQISVTLSEDGDGLTFVVWDDGIGFDPSEVPLDRGLAGCRDRLDTLGGHLEVISAVGNGTSVRGRLPVKGDEVQSGNPSRVALTA